MLVLIFIIPMLLCIIQEDNRICLVLLFVDLKQDLDYTIFGITHNIEIHICATFCKLQGLELISCYFQQITCKKKY